MRDPGYLHRILASADALTWSEFEPTRRGFILAALLSALPVALLSTVAHAGEINPSETSVALPDAIEWSSWIKGFPPHSGQIATTPTFGSTTKLQHIRLHIWSVFIAID